MHCPPNMNGTQYVALVAALSSVLSEQLDAENTLILSELLDSVSDQLLTIAAFKQAEQDRRRHARDTLGQNLAQAAVIDRLRD